MRGLVVLLAVLGSSGLVVPARADDVADVRQATLAVLSAYTSGDVETIDSHWLPESSIFLGEGQLLAEPGFNKARYQAAFAEGLKFDFQWRHLSVKVYGSTAITTGYFEGTVSLPSGEILQGPWRSSGFWVKKDGKWKLAHVHNSYLLPAPPR
jgi:ketosteroid isomerase-like protein